MTTGSHFAISMLLTCTSSTFVLCGITKMANKYQIAFRTNVGQESLFIYTVVRLDGKVLSFLKIICMSVSKDVLLAWVSSLRLMQCEN